MKVLLDNVDLSSSSGPNHFGKKLKTRLDTMGHICSTSIGDPDVQLSFIETRMMSPRAPLAIRMDGIYFDPEQGYKQKNANILRSYNMASGIVFQSQYCKELAEHYFGKHDNPCVIYNGVDVSNIQSVAPLQDPLIDKYQNVWVTAARWRRWKRLKENIEYFLQFSGPNDCLVVAGDARQENIQVKHDRIFFVGRLEVPVLFSLYRRATYLVHLARFDSCPNTVIDARAAGCKVICSSLAGTKEIAGPDALVVYDEPWDYSPASTTELPPMDFNKISKNVFDTDIDIGTTAEKYESFLSTMIE